MYTLDDLVILSVLQFSDVHVDSSPIEVQRADIVYDFLHMPANVAVHLERGFWGGRLDGLASTLGDPLERRVSFMLTTMLIAAVGGNRTLLQRFPGRVGIRPRFSARNIRQPRRVLHCSRGLH